jgi:hypothetical protein
VFTYHTPRHSARHQRKAQEEHQPRLPRHPGPAITVAVRAQPRLLDRVDDQHAQRGADARDPVDELDVLRARVVVLRVGRGVDEDEEADRELEGMKCQLESERRSGARWGPSCGGWGLRVVEESWGRTMAPAR